MTMVTKFYEATYVDINAFAFAAFVHWLHAMATWHDPMPSCHLNKAIFIDGATSDGSSDSILVMGPLRFNDHAP